jgi:hypothetical protein
VKHCKTYYNIRSSWPLNQAKYLLVLVVPSSCPPRVPSINSGRTTRIIVSVWHNVYNQSEEKPIFRRSGSSAAVPAPQPFFTKVHVLVKLPCQMSIITDQRSAPGSSISILTSYSINEICLLTLSLLPLSLQWRCFTEACHLGKG